MICISNNHLIFIFFFLQTIAKGSLFGQPLDSRSLSTDFDLHELALLDIEPNTPILTLELYASTAAGENVISVTDASHWINYSSAIAPFSSVRNISAAIASGNLPLGMEIELQAGPYQGDGAGAFGIPTAAITLDSSSQIIIQNIGGAYTASGENKGHQLFYSLRVTDYALLDASYDQEVLTVVFTLSDY
jgi:hypothetical protein